MRKGKVIIVLSLLLAICTACQPTPEEEIVQNRKDGSLEQAIVATAAPTFAPEEKYEVPEKWTEELEFRGEKIYIDADIEVADEDAFEILTITTNYFNPKEETVPLVHTFLGDNIELREQEQSYDELLEELQVAQRGVYSGYNEATGETIWSPYEGQKERIQELKDLLAQTSPEDSFVTLDDNLEFPFSRRLIRTEAGERWYLMCKAGAFILQKYRNGIVQTEELVMMGDAYPGEKGHNLEVTGITEEEAIEKAMAFIAPLERADLQAADIEKARIIDDYTYDVLDTGYYVYIVGNPSGTIPCLYGKYSGSHVLDFTANSKQEYQMYWAQEEITVFVSADGIQEFIWGYRKKVVDVANENVQIMPFEQVQERIRTLLEFGVQEGNNDPVHINRIILGSAIQQIPDQGEEAFMVPAWMVFFTPESDIALGRGESLMMISALDGSYISQWG